MLNRIRAALAPKRAEAPAQADAAGAADALAFFSGQIAEMPAIAPPVAGNQDPMAGVAEVVERELRVAGYLR